MGKVCSLGLAGSLTQLRLTLTHATTHHPDSATPHPESATPHPDAATQHPDSATPHTDSVTTQPYAQLRFTNVSAPRTSE